MLFHFPTINPQRRRPVSSRVGPPGVVPSILHLTAGSLLLCSTLFASDCVSAGPEVSSQLLAESWSEVVEVLEAVPAGSPVNQFLLGHAYLALNQNNESLCLFLLAESPSGRAAWDAWSAEFARDNDEHSVVHYLRGDALARLGQWDEAISSFDRALQITPTDHLSMNAKAVALAGAGQWNAATVLLSEVVELVPEFADAYGSRGTINVKRSQGPDGAIRWFDRALEIVPDFSLALNGRGSVRVATGKWDAAQEDLEGARDASACTMVAIENLVALEVGRIEELAQRGDLADGEAGTSMSRSFRTPADQRMGGLQSAHRAAMTAGAFSDVIGSASSGLIPDVLTNTLNNYRTDRLSDASRIGNQILDDNYTSVRNAMTQNPNGGAARAWQARGIMDANHLTRDVFENPPPTLNTPGGVDLSMRNSYVDTGNWSVDTWFGLGYEVPAEHLPAAASPGN